MENTEPTLVIIDDKIVKATAMVQPTLSIIGPLEPSKPGELMVMEAKLENEYAQFITAAKIKWTVSEEGQVKKHWIDGRRVVFGAGVKATKIQVDAKLSLHYSVNGEEIVKVLTATRELKVGAVNVNNAETISSLVAAWAKDPNILPQDEMLKKGSKALATSFKKISTQIGDEALNEVKQIMLTTKDSNKEALIAAGIDPLVWNAWAKNLQAYLKSKSDDKELVSIPQYKKLWWEISAGLWTVK
jgi:hypothetical protein